MIRRLFLISAMALTVSSCITITQSDFGPSDDNGNVSLVELSEKLGVPQEKIAFAHSGFFVPMHRPGESYIGRMRDNEPATLVITNENIHILIWDQRTLSYKLIWSKGHRSITDLYVEKFAMLSGVTIETASSANGAIEIVGFAVTEWTGFSDHDAAKEAEQIFANIEPRQSD